MVKMNPIREPFFWVTFRLGQLVKKKTEYSRVPNKTLISKLTLRNLKMFFLIFFADNNECPVCVGKWQNNDQLVHTCILNSLYMV